jgi:hypothetical protein
MSHTLGTYNFSISEGSKSTTWTITHNLDSTDVAVDAMINSGGSPNILEKAIPLSQTATSSNVVTLTWSSQQWGRARVVAGGYDVG